MPTENLIDDPQESWWFCIVCGKYVYYGTGGLCWIGRNAVTCNGKCTEIAKECIKDYEKSSRGKFRSRKAWLQEIKKRMP